MLLLIEAAFIFLLGLIYVMREMKRKIKNYRTGDIIWVRENLFKKQKAILCNWNDYTFNYIPEDSFELKVKNWFFLIRNESYQQRKEKEV
ncbi:hypothetical protein AAE02nite_43210 [Adhaeribacter aerolatus]|uniref:Uncharacterized protein n=1 Tax=Adhaeribacter aerolatus TaxID=670289 RepID=A0A512B4F7_9BACT|nr:hypothetical protein [Adhaeribacter aerolatus]GEO06657.1 hypothetical protein AAE02nite_43210 [Adhaeribacter aerolatus]